ncbi:hypothetical protein OS493_029190 [Desmophyllum pertusum]|uniref:Uncharacterized protein n=1 Tax=Desmophyllum pertusum TaxID=174260 RepID=A0A9W9ZZ56_9CNID|nr:hypothetical protein OS493_029190 [Desmophyllum pertusum]
MEFNRALNGDSTGPSRALIQATQSPPESRQFTLRALLRNGTSPKRTLNNEARIEIPVPGSR